MAEVRPDAEAGTETTTDKNLFNFLENILCEQQFLRQEGLRFVRVNFQDIL